MIRSLSAKIGVLSASLLIGFGLVMEVAFHQLSNRQVDRTIRADAGTANGQLNVALQDAADRLRTVTTYAATRDASVRGLAFSRDPGTIQDELPNVAKVLEVDGAQFADQNGRILGQSGLADPNALLTASPQTLVDYSTANGFLVYASRDVALPSEKYGTLRFYRALDRAKLASLARSLGAEIALVADGHILSSSLDRPVQIPDSGNPTSTVLAGKSYIELLAPFKLPGSAASVQLLTLKDTRSITAPYTQAQILFTGVLLAALIVSIAAGHWFGTGIIRPLQGIVAAAKRVQEGSWPEGFTNLRSDEIGELQRAFNDMVAASRAAQSKLLEHVDRDPLTELSNHRRFRERLTQQVGHCALAHQTMSLLLVDLDGFGSFNDANGHAQGDRLLVQLGQLIAETAPQDALLGRYGPDCFSIGLIGTTSRGAVDLAIDLQRAVGQAGLGVTASIGISEFPRNSNKAEGLVLAAELGLSLARQRGPGNQAEFDEVPGASDTDPFELNRYLENGSLATIQALAAAVDAKDNYTNGHSMRVARYATDLAIYIGLSSEETDRIFRCGTLHDVGKIGVPDAILQKPGRLDPEELKIMQTHSVLGEMIVAKVPQLADLLPGVRHHHEAWNGTGYPDGLAGEAIPKIARMLALADTFDAMTSDRPYRKGMDVEVALAEIEKCAARQFDPDLAPAFVQMMRDQFSQKAA